MLKIVGALLIIAACTGAGYVIAQSFISRTKEIRQLQNILSYMETEILYGHTPLLTIINNICKRERGNIAKIFALIDEKLCTEQKSFATCWQEGFNQGARLTSLKERELQIMLRLGDILGQSDRESQQKYIRIALTHLQTEEKDAHDQQIKYEKLSRTLGLLTGILIVILLI